MRSMADKVFAETEARRTRICSRAGELARAYLEDCERVKVGLDDWDQAVIWDAAIACGRTEDDHRILARQGWRRTG